MKIRLPKFSFGKREEGGQDRRPTASLPGIRILSPRAMKNPTPEIELPPPAETSPSRPGGIRKTKPAEWRPDMQRTGGRIVKRMPRNLEKLKDTPEAPADE